MSPSHIRVRFAPSPTGHLHIGGARTALYNWLYARQTGGTFVLRIEDTDAARSTEESYRAILEAMEWLGLDWDEGPDKGGPHGPYQQSSRQVLYHNEVQKMVAAGSAYHCFCDAGELAEMRNDAKGKGGAPKYDGRCRQLPDEEVEHRIARKVPHVIRFKMDKGETKFFDLIRGAFVFNNDDLDDFVLIKSDGRPTYNFAVVVDDNNMQISHVIRGDDHLSNTPRQVCVYRALGYRLPKFAHLPMILGSDRARLSKRHGAASVQEFERMGYLNDGIINYLALLGWSLDDKTEFFSRENLIRKFSLKRVGKNPAAFDMDKLNHIDGEHLKSLDLKQRASLVFDRLSEARVLPADFEVQEWSSVTEVNGFSTSNGDDATYRGELPRLAIMLKVIGNRLRNIKDAPTMLAYFYKDDYPVDDEAYKTHLANPATATHLDALAEALAAVTPFDRGSIEQSVRNLAERLTIKAGDLIHPCRVALTGKSVSPDIFSVIHLLGKDKCVQRIRLAADHITKL